MQKTILQPTIYEMTCDVCGKKESIKDDKVGYCREFYIRHWAEIHIMEPFNLTFPSTRKRMDLCPKCARKLKKFIMAVELESED